MEGHHEACEDEEALVRLRRLGMCIFVLRALDSSGAVILITSIIRLIRMAANSAER